MKTEASRKIWKDSIRRRINMTYFMVYTENTHVFEKIEYSSSAWDISEKNYVDDLWKSA